MSLFSQACAPPHPPPPPPQRYIAEISDDEKRTSVGEKAVVKYSEASKVAADSLPSTHPIRLGLALNFSVFHFEILRQPTEACELAKKAFDDAIAELDTLSEE